MTTTGIKRYVVRPAKRVDSPKDNGKFIANLNSELQAKLSERKDPVGEPASSPLKMKRIGGGGRRKSAPEKTTAAVRVNPSSGKTKWHVQEDQLKQPSPSQVRSVSYLKSTIPPPPKNPPPVLALKTQTPDSSKASLQKSLSAVPPKHSHKQEIQIHPPSSPPSISSPPSSSSPLSSPSSADPTTRRDSVKVPLCGSTSVGGVRELMMVFESDQTKRATEKQRAKDSLFIKTNSEPKDIGRKVLTEADSPTRNTSSLATIKQSKREEKMEALDGKCIIINPEVHSATSSKESLGGVFSSSDYINVFEDEDFARFDKRSQAQKLQQNNSMGRRDKKPKPLPRKGSCGTFPVCRNSSNNSSLSSLNSLHFSSGFDMSLSEKPELDKPDISKGMERVDVDISERMERVNAGTSEEIEGVNEDSSEGTEGVKGDTSKGIEGVNVELSMEMEGVNSKETSGVTVDVSNGTERVNITENASKPDVTMSSQPLDALETEIDLLADIGKLPPLTDTEAAQAEPTLSVHKQELSKTKSHIPTTGGIPITRRTTPKERKELRHGVCSDGAQIESDEDDYIPMNPICLMSRTFGEPHQLLVPPTDPRASGYYLKVLPNDVISVTPSASQDRPKSPGDVYIDMDTAKDLKSLPVPEATKSTARPSPMTTNRENTPIGGGSLHAQQTSRNQIQPGKFRGLKYSDVTIEQPGRASIKDQAASPPINYQQVQLGKQLPSNVKESSGTTEPKKSMFADRPLPPRPDHDCPYYITNSVPMGTVPPPPVLQSMLNRRTVWHEYVEIDEEELEKLSSPPDVPKRPMNLDKLAERKNIPSVEYSYAAVPGKNMFGLYWINFQARNPTASITPPSEVVSKRSTPPPRAVDRNETLPPPPPPKSESLLREQGLIPTPQPYLTPLFKKRKMSVPIIPLTNSTPLPSLISHPKDRAQLMRRESSDEDGVRMKGKSVPTKSNQGQSRRRTPPPRPSPPRLKSTSGPAVVTVGENRDKALRGERSKAVPSGLRPLFHQQRSLDEEGREDKVKGHKKLARQRSCSTGDLSGVSGRNRLRESKSSVPDSGGRKSPTIGVTMATDTVETKQVARQPPQVTTQTQEAPIRRQNLRVRNKIDRQSLAIIMQNREAIVRQLSIAKADGRQVNVNTDGSGSDKQLLLRSLGEILLEIDALLRHNLCTEEDLVSAIEQQLSIKLQPCKETSASSTPPNSSVSIESPTAQSRQYNQSGESMSPGQPNKLPWQHSVVITDQDVDEVLSFVKINGIMSPEKENPPEFPPPEQHIKPRSGTVIILDDPPSPHERTHMENNLHSPDSPDSDHDSKTCDCGLVAAKESELARSFDHTLHNRVDLWSSPSKGMRDQRSFSAGQKPLRRVNAKRRPSASDLETASCNTAFCNGAGTFTHKGGRLTNMISGVEIEIPEGAIPKGRKQRLWFDVVQAVYDPREEEEEMQRSLSSSASGETKPENHERKDRKVELSPMILVGPCDAALLRPIKIKLPHCLPYRNNSWHLQMVARVQNSTSEDWIELSNSSGLIIPERNKKRKFFKNSTYQMSLEFATVRTKHLGCFRLCGNPIRHGTHSAKKMVASVYTRRERSRDDGIVSLDIFLTNAITDQIQALDFTLSSNNYICLERNVPVLCFGDGKDMELTLSCDTNSTTPLSTRTIPFGHFWRLKKVGQPHVVFSVDTSLLESSRTLTLRIQQAGAKIVHETNFLLP